VPETHLDIDYSAPMC